MAATSKQLAKSQFSDLRSLDIFEFRRFRLSQKVKTQLARKSLTAAENPKNPKAPDLAFEVSKCFSAGFGISEEVESMELWLSIAANRDHPFAKALCTKLKISAKGAIPAEEMKSSDNPEPEMTSLVLEMERTYSKVHHPKETSILISSYHRLDDYEEGGSRHNLEYLKALQAFVEAFEKQDLLYSLDDHGETLLFFAALCGDAVAVRVLLDAGLSVLSVGCQGCTVLHNALVGAFHLSPAEEMEFQGLESPGEQRPAKVRALAAFLQLLLDAGVGPNSEFVDGVTPVKPLHMAIMASWHLENTALVELLCERGAQSNTVAPALCGAQPLHVASEVQTFIQSWGVDFNSPPLQISSDEQGEALEAKQLTIMRSLVRLLNFAGVSFISHKDWRNNATADAIWKCSPLGLLAMLAEGVSPAKALGTGQAACHHAAQWVEAIGKKRERDPEPRLVESASVWLKARLRCRIQNEEILREYSGSSDRGMEIEELVRLKAEGHDKESSQ